MKEKISRNKISRHYKSFFGLENMGLGENDNLMIDWGESLVNDFCNQEVEKRIKERIKNLPRYDIVDYDGGMCRHMDGDWLNFEEVRSRLTCSEKPNNSQKMEGGEG